MRRSFNIFGAASRIDIDEPAACSRCAGSTASATWCRWNSPGDKNVSTRDRVGREALLLFLDEATAGMSIDEARSTMELVDRLNRDLAYRCWSRA